MRCEGEVCIVRRCMNEGREVGRMMVGMIGVGVGV